MPTGRLAFYFLSSIFISAVLVERQPVMALMLYLVVSGLGAADRAQPDHGVAPTSCCLAIMA